MAARNWQIFGGIFSKHAKLAPITFAKLPGSPETGEMACVSDAGQNTVGSAVTSGSSTLKVLVWWNGTQWTCFGK